MSNDFEAPHLNLNLDLNLSQYRWQTFSASCFIDAIAWCMNSFAPTLGAAARARQTAAVAKDKVTVLTECRVQDEPFRCVARDGFHDMAQMFLNLPLADAQYLCQLAR